MINIVVATSRNLVIGKGNKLPWHLPSDLEHFKRLTTGHSVLMGRKTWESLPNRFRPLPNRKNIILTRDTSYKAEGATIINNMDSIIKTYKNSSNELFIIGGGEIYKEAFSYADKLYLTTINSDIEGDTYLEGLNLKEWELVDIDRQIEDGDYTYNICAYIKK